MTIVSMTGYAEAQGSRDGARWRWEAKSVNGRGLDVRLRAPPGFEAIDPVARTLVGERFRRGSIQMQLTFEPGDASRGLKIDAAALAAAVRIAREVASETGLAPARVDGLLALKGVIVQDVKPNSFAEDVGLGRGDVILEVNKQPVNNEDDFRKMQANLKSGQDVVFLVRQGRGRNAGTIFLGGTLP